jgi:hypothetical protein
MLRARQFPESDLDARFIFTWIAVNALYGQAKYRHGDVDRTSELKDIKEFLKCVLRLDNDAIQRALRAPRIRDSAETLLGDRFLSDNCWRKWDAEGVVEKKARESSCAPVTDHTSDLMTLFSRLYVLRKQIFHGCSTDRGSKNRPSLVAAVPVLETLVRTFIGIVEFRGSGEIVLEKPPYPPSQVSGG